MKRLSWEEYFMGLVQLASKRSEDPNTKVGAVIVNSKNRIIGVGYNGMPDGKEFTWKRNAKNISDTKYPYVIHAEVNAILNSIKEIEGATIYVSLFPCSNCAKLLVQSGIKKVIFGEDKYKDTEDGQIAHYIFKKSKVKTQKGKNIKITFE